ncbi:MAG TPA: glycosyltransferase family 2 protein [Candidatus Saccharimonadales bacterium]|nr:glycosyltransferase family 2 protein [Candidatus Saccharimonadales bacterium]
MSLRVAFVIPAYNEDKVIGDVVKGLAEALAEQTYESSIVVVDDGSKDATAKVAEQAGAIVIRHILNTGSGGATATGLSYAQQQGFDIATTLDADGQHIPKDVLRGVELIQQNQADLLIGSRLIDASGMSNVKVLGNRGLSALTLVLFGVKVTDSQSGLRVFSNRALNELRWRTSGFEFCSEMLWRAKQSGLVIEEYPIKAIYTEYSLSKGQSNWNSLHIVKSLVQRRILELLGE